MHADERIVTTITTTGRAQAAFSSVTYTFKAEAEGVNSVEARTKVTPVIEAVKCALRGVAAEAVIDTERLLTSLVVENVQRHDHSIGKLVHLGYRAVFTLRCDGQNLAAASRVQDLFTSIEGVTADTPRFNIDDRRAAEEAAFKVALNRAKEQFKDQCAAMRLDPNDFDVKRWGFVDSSMHDGKTMALGGEEDGNLRPGQAEIFLLAEFQFWRRDAK